MDMLYLDTCVLLQKALVENKYIVEMFQNYVDEANILIKQILFKVN